MTNAFVISITVIFFSLLQSSKDCKATKNQHCPRTSCGTVTDISYPFRLKGDPKNCGEPDYELGCENNRTIFYSGSHRFFVQSISYGEQKSIRVLNPCLEKTTCASSSVNNIGFIVSIEKSYIVNYELSLNTPILYISCEAPVKSVSNGLLIHTSFSCKKKYKFSYFIVGDVKARSLEDGCMINWVALISKEFSIVDDADIQDALAHGLDLGWETPGFRHCWDCTEGQMCMDISGRYQCLVPCTIFHPRTLRPTRECLRDAWSDLCYWLEDNYRKVVNIIAPIIVPRSFCGFLFLFALLAYKFKRRHLSMYDNIEEFLQSQNNFMPIRYSYRELKNMTKNFKDKLGEGGCGTVYKGQLRSRPFIAVKILGKTKASGQEFINEVATIGRIHHVNIVRLIGFCVQGSNRALVYEFMPNGSLEKYIFLQQETSLSNLNYSKIFEIALGVAKGIDYLHRGCDMQILHFDIKPHNILLDHDCNPKISDFGLAKLYPTDESMVSLTAARGTMGYMAPEMFYRNIGKVSYKSDVYSFGMLLMEMASKRRNLNASVENISQIYFPCWVHDRFNKRMEIDLGDASLDERIIVKKMALVALWCIQMKPSDRPSMIKVIEMLEGDIELLQLAPRPFLSPEEMLVEERNTVINDNAEFPLLWRTKQVDTHIEIEDHIMMERKL